MVVGGVRRLIRRVLRRKTPVNNASKEAKRERNLMAHTVGWFFRNSWAVAYSISFWTASSLLSFGMNAFNNALTRGSKTYRCTTSMLKSMLTWLLIHGGWGVVTCATVFVSPSPSPSREIRAI